MKNNNSSIAVIIPCYKVKQHILDVIEKVGEDICSIYVIDDNCPEKSGQYVKNNCDDKRVHIIFHEKNEGVGGATITGYKQALNDGADIVVKIDGDGQMNPAMIKKIVGPIIKGEADYTKGNRFYNIEDLAQMPIKRLIGNAALSFISKLSSGYWNIFDPTNGYTAIHSSVIEQLPLDKIDKRYFFESDILFRLNTIRAVVHDIPMPSVYGDEKSNLKISKILGEFTIKHMTNIMKRLFYNYYLRDFSIASLEILLGSTSLSFGIIFGILMWIDSTKSGVPATSGTVMLAALPVLIGIQLILAFLSYDTKNVPQTPLQKNSSKSNRSIHSTL